MPLAVTKEELSPAGPAARITDLRKDFGPPWRRRRAIDGLDFEIPRGSAVGLLGPNGAGKTTLIRCMLGLTRPSSGTIELFGLSVPEALDRLMPRVGAVLDAGWGFPRQSGRENLRFLARTGAVPEDLLSGALERVGLLDRADDLVGSYSTGMRQRLAIAAAIVKEPGLLVLDEPTSGLDPHGRRDVRRLVANFRAEGRTVLMSSHLVADVEDVCDRVVIMDKARCVASGTVDELIGAWVRLSVANEAGTPAAELSRLAYDEERACRSALLRREEAAVLQTAEEWKALEKAGTARIEAATLEDIFLELTGSAATVHETPQG